MGRIVPKATDNWQFSISNLTGGSYLNIGFLIYENFNTENGDYDSMMTYSYTLNTSNLSLLQVLDSDAGFTNYIKVASGNVVFEMSRGEYQDLAGNVYRVEEVFNQIIAALGA